MKYVRKAISLLQISTPSATAATTTMQKPSCIMYPVIQVLLEKIITWVRKLFK